jgi:multidrug efflux system membrane fusion protein
MDLVRTNLASKSLTADVYPTQVQTEKLSGSGNIVFIDNTIDSASGTFKLRVRLDNDAEQFWPGQSLNVTVNAGKIDNLVTVPFVALQPRTDGYVCYVVHPDNTVELRKVTLALSDGKVAGLSQGLADGDTVVVEGQASLTNGSHVTVAEQTHEAAPNTDAIVGTKP